MVPGGAEEPSSFSESNSRPECSLEVWQHGLGGLAWDRDPLIFRAGILPPLPGSCPELCGGSLLVQDPSQPVLSIRYKSLRAFQGLRKSLIIGRKSMGSKTQKREQHNRNEEMFNCA